MREESSSEKLHRKLYGKAITCQVCGKGSVGKGGGTLAKESDGKYRHEFCKGRVNEKAEV